jgi:O-antigen ligase
MTALKFSRISILLVIFLAAELLSYFTWSLTLVNQLIFAGLFLMVLLLSIYRLEYGLLIVLGELFIGSMGHLFYFNVGGYQIPIRIALWGAVMLVFTVKFIGRLINQGKASDYYQKIKNFAYLKYFALLFLFILIGLINGLLRGQAFSHIFNDFNAWLYLLLLFPLIIIYGSKETRALNILKNLFLASALWLSLKTLFLLFVFTHNLGIAPDIYLWLRKTLSGEMTMTLTSWPRIFIQGQIYSGIAWFLALWFSLTSFKFKQFFKKQNLLLLLTGACFFSSILISFSRSFWVGLAMTLLISLILIGRFYSFSLMAKTFVWVILSGFFGFLLIYLITIFPYPSPGQFKADFLDRISNQNEAAVSSRWSLLPVLIKEIGREPFFGQGYGATITYLSRDPRVLANNPSGEYTTYAFEWGYLDMWLKLGILGLAAYLLLIVKIIIAGTRRSNKDNYLFLGLISGLLFLAITNVFTPYLNHPLGLGFLLLASCLIQPDRVY